jgi:phosphoglycolate phosphatase-like HAD superfamily hydrolase
MPSTDKKLLLWDIDGTLIWGGGGGERALLCAMRDAFGVEADLAMIDYAGRTDRRIGDMLMAHYGAEATEDNRHAFIESYLENLAREIPLGEPYTHPGVLEILERAAADPRLHQGLLTGNMARGARIKLSHFDLWHYFEFGAFADDSADRNQLSPRALERAIEKAGYHFPPENVYVIGDTPHDIECGKIIGARTIAVATGTSGVEDLRAHAPDAVFADFSDPDAFFAVVGGK